MVAVVSFEILINRRLSRLFSVWSVLIMMRECVVGGTGADPVSILHLVLYNCPDFVFDLKSLCLHSFLFVLF